MRACNSCRITKPYHEFHVDHRRPSGRRPDCRACIALRSRDYYRKNRRRIRAAGKSSEIKAKKAEYRRRNRDRINSYQKRVRNRPHNKFALYRATSRRRAIPFMLSFSEFMAFWRKPCLYCGGAIETIGIDRIENATGYTQGNVAPCCRRCNAAKGAMSLRAFIQMCVQVVKRRAQFLDRSVWHDAKAEVVVKLPVEKASNTLNSFMDSRARGGNNV